MLTPVDGVFSGISPGKLRVWLSHWFNNGAKVERNSGTFGSPSDLPLNNEPVAFLPLQTPLCGELYKRWHCASTTIVGSDKAHYQRHCLCAPGSKQATVRPHCSPEP
ncbi:hypothetical protein ABG768_025383 [Culter alburnus]|uniref:Uncharacterized protein n=1 Tax=Culter alburnus TaxID=194366 RepID=A0AAW2AHM3_CULAL